MDPYTRISQSYARLRSAPCDGVTWADLARHYGELHMGWQARYAAEQALRFGAAVALRGTYDGVGGERRGAPQGGLCERELSQAVARCPVDWLSWLFLARLREKSGRADAGVFALQRAQALEPLAGESLHWLGARRLAACEPQAAVNALSQLLPLRPVRYDSMLCLAEALMETGDAAGAQRAFDAAARARDPELLRSLRAALFRYRRDATALAVAQHLVTEHPDNVEDRLALAGLQVATWDFDAARRSVTRVHALRAREPRADLLGARMLQGLGDAQGAAAMLRMLRDGGEPPAGVAGALAITAQYCDDFTPAEKKQLHDALGLSVAANTAVTEDDAPGLAEAVVRPQRRRLRLGYICGDLRAHCPQGQLLLALLLEHDPLRFDIHVYCTQQVHDATTQHARDAAAHWHQAHAWSGAEFASHVRRHGIDVLVDMGNPASTYRDAAFCARLAPVQACFAGYAQTSGLPAMDWLIGDKLVTPATHGHLYTEGIAQMPASVLCWAPLDPVALPQRRAEDAALVFGACGEAIQFSPRTVALWARVLAAVPGARLLLQAPSFADGSVRERFEILFAEHGIGEERLELRGCAGPAEALHAWGDIDIALDPLPCNGGMASLQALWMGVPFVTRCGDNYASRLGASVLTALGRPDWIAMDDAAYVRIAVALASQRPALLHCRAALRQRVRTSPVGDMRQYTRDLETLYTRMWQRWRRRSPSRLLAAQASLPAAAQVSVAVPAAAVA